ncbi:MAG: FecR domain-containing protein [Lachnospiraceae bacterium]|nr:FecR domain-containing protein [Lachnospiraceae bacterium]
MRNKKRRGRIIAALLSATLTVSLLAGCGGSKTAATTIRLLKYLGEVTMTEDGKTTALMENMSLHNGNAITTGVESEVDLSLDDTKFVGLNPESEAQFYQDGKKLDIKFLTGGLYFYTTEKLKDDEEMTFDTGDMLVGIRGTSGAFEKNRKTRETTLYATSGNIDVSLKDEKGNVIESGTLTPGQKVTARRGDSEQSSDDDYLDFGEYQPEDLPANYLKKMNEKEDLMGEVVQKGGFDETMMTTLAATAASGGNSADLAAAAEGVRQAQVEGMENPDASGAGTDGAGLLTADAADGQNTEDNAPPADTPQTDDQANRTPQPEPPVTAEPVADQPEQTANADDANKDDNKQKDDKDSKDDKKDKKDKDDSSKKDKTKKEKEESDSTNNTSTTDPVTQAMLAAMMSGGSSSSSSTPAPTPEPTPEPQQEQESSDSGSSGSQQPQENVEERSFLSETTYVSCSLPAENGGTILIYGGVLALSFSGSTESSFIFSALNGAVTVKTATTSASMGGQDILEYEVQTATVRIGFTEDGSASYVKTNGSDIPFEANPDGGGIYADLGSDGQEHSWRLNCSNDQYSLSPVN